MKLSLISFYLLAAQLIFTLESGSQSLYFPPLTGTDWQIVTPESLNWNTANIDTLLNFLAANRTKAFIVLKDGRIVIEQYFDPFTSSSNWYWASAGKSMTAFLVGIAQQEGILSIYDSTSHYIGSGWTSCTPEQEEKITILHQLTMTTGLKDNVSNPECTLPECLVYEADAGSRWAYHTAPYTLLDKVIENTSGQSYNKYFDEKIRSRIGMNGLWVQMDYNNVYVSNARSMARFALLVLNKGVWDSDTLMTDTSYFRQMTTSSQNLNPSYGYLWWLNGKESYMIPLSRHTFSGSWAPDAPTDMIAALGKNGQFINIVPSQRLIMVRMGEAPDTSYDVPVEFNNDIWKKLNNVLYDHTTVSNCNILDKFSIMQNYPNPFNPKTVIRYSVPAVGTSFMKSVKLKIYDLLGREIATLADGIKSPGEHTVEWNAQNYPSGIYFYRLTSGMFSETKKLVLLK